MDITAVLETISSGAAAVDGALKALKVAKELLKSNAIDPKANDVIHQRLNEALEQMIEVKEQRLALLEAAVTLRSEKAAFDAKVSGDNAFITRSDKYRLRTIAPNSLAYSSNEESDGQPAHYACVRCFDERAISVLQLERRDFNYDILICHRCSARVQCENDHRAEVVIVPRRRDDFLRGGWDDL